MGIKYIYDEYWNTCTVRILWLHKALWMFVLILQDFELTNDSPVDIAHRALDAALYPMFNWTLKTAARYIVSACVYKTRRKFYERIGVGEDELNPHLEVLS